MAHFWLRAAVTLYGAGLLYALAALMMKREIMSRVMMPVVGIGMLLHLVALTESMLAAGHPGDVISTQYPSLLALLMMLFFFAVYWRYRITSHGIFVLPVAFFLTLSALLSEQGPQFSTPLLRNGWIYLHIALIFLGYAALFLSFASSILYLIQERSLKNKRLDGLMSRLPSLAVMDDIGLRSLVLGFPFMTLGLIAGSVVAQESYGPAYFRDPKIMLSLVMWAVYMVLLFTRWTNGWRGRRAALLSSVAFVSATLAWAASYFSTVHRYVEPPR